MENLNTLQNTESVVKSIMKRHKFKFEKTKANSVIITRPKSVVVASKNPLLYVLDILGVGSIIYMLLAGHLSIGLFISIGYILYKFVPKIEKQKKSFNSLNDEFTFSNEKITITNKGVKNSILTEDYETFEIYIPREIEPILGSIFVILNNSEKVKLIELHSKSREHLESELNAIINYFLLLLDN